MRGLLSFSCRLSDRFPPRPLPWNRLHVLANHLVVSGLPIAHVSGDDEDVTSKTEREQGLVDETDIDAKRPVREAELERMIGRLTWRMRFQEGLCRRSPNNAGSQHEYR